MFLKNSAELNFELDAKDYYGRTAFLRACWNSKTRVVELLINNSEAFKLDLTATDNVGKTGFKWAQDNVKYEVVNLIKSKMPNIAF